MTPPRTPGAWKKSSYSANTDNCVEVARGTETLLRDTKNRQYGQLRVDAAGWQSLLRTIKDGRFAH